MAWAATTWLRTDAGPETSTSVGSTVVGPSSVPAGAATSGTVTGTVFRPTLSRLTVTRSGSDPCTEMRSSIDSTWTITLLAPLPGSIPARSIQALKVEVIGRTPDGAK